MLSIEQGCLDAGCRDAWGQGIRSISTALSHPASCILAPSSLTQANLRPEFLTGQHSKLQSLPCTQTPCSSSQVVVISARPGRAKPRSWCVNMRGLSAGTLARSSQTFGSPRTPAAAAEVRSQLLGAGLDACLQSRRDDVPRFNRPDPGRRQSCACDRFARSSSASCCDASSTERSKNDELQYLRRCRPPFRVSSTLLADHIHELKRSDISPDAYAKICSPQANDDAATRAGSSLQRV